VSLSHFSVNTNGAFANIICHSQSHVIIHISIPINSLKATWDSRGNGRRPTHFQWMIIVLVHRINQSVCQSLSQPVSSSGSMAHTKDDW